MASLGRFLKNYFYLIPTLPLAKGKGGKRDIFSGPPSPIAKRGG